MIKAAVLRQSELTVRDKPRKGLQTYVLYIYMYIYICIDVYIHIHAYVLFLFPSSFFLLACSSQVMPFLLFLCLFFFSFSSSCGRASEENDNENHRSYRVNHPVGQVENGNRRGRERLLGSMLDSKFADDEAGLPPSIPFFHKMKQSIQ